MSEIPLVSREDLASLPYGLYRLQDQLRRVYIRGYGPDPIDCQSGQIYDPIMDEWVESNAERMMTPYVRIRPSVDDKGRDNFPPGLPESFKRDDGMCVIIAYGKPDMGWTWRALKTETGKYFSMVIE
jgi:hypothetical protein